MRLDFTIIFMSLSNVKMLILQDAVLKIRAVNDVRVMLKRT